MALRHIQSKALILDTDSLSAVTATFEASSGAVYKSMYVVGKTGTHGTHQVQLEASPDGGTTWFSMGSAVTGAAVLAPTLCQCYDFRAKVTVAEGATSTCDIYIFAV